MAQPCSLCNLHGSWMILHVPGTQKSVCAACLHLLKEAEKAYIANVIHKAKHHKPDSLTNDRP